MKKQQTSTQKRQEKALKNAREIKIIATKKQVTLLNTTKTEKRDFTPGELKDFNKQSFLIESAEALIKDQTVAAGAPETAADNADKAARAKAAKKAARQGQATRTADQGATEKKDTEKKPAKTLFPETEGAGEFIRETSIKISIPKTIKGVKLYKDTRGTPALFRLVLELQGDDDIKGQGEAIDDAIKDFKKEYKKNA